MTQQRHDDVVAVRLQPGTGAAMAGKSQPRGDLRDPRQRTDATPAVVAGDHEEQRQRGDRDRPEQPARHVRQGHVDHEEAEEDHDGHAGDRLDPPRV